MKRSAKATEKTGLRPSSLRHSASTVSILITAGPTREYIDPVRYLSNDSSGQMGFALAAEAKKRGYRVTLIHGPVNLAAPIGIRTVSVVSAADMLRACSKEWPRHDVLIMAAAVADYRPRNVSAIKIKKQKADLTLKLEPTVDILATLVGKKEANQRVIGFALEDRNPRERAHDKLMRKNLDAIVLNAPRAIAAGSSRIEILLAGGKWVSHKHASKAKQASAVLDVVDAFVTRDES